MLGFLILWVGRLCLPFSLLIAIFLDVIFNPIEAFQDILEWPNTVKSMWDDPL